MVEIVMNEKHEYFVDGRPMPGVTTILKEVLGLNFDFIGEFHRDKGIQLHTACELRLKNGCDPEVDPRLEGQLKGFNRFLEETRFEPIYIEKKIYNPIYKYCGTLDLFGELQIMRKKALIDIKGGGKCKHYRLQTALYGDVLDYEPLSYLRLCLHLKPDGTYFFDHHDDVGDYAAALSVVNAYYARRNYA